MINIQLFYFVKISPGKGISIYFLGHYRMPKTAEGPNNQNKKILRNRQFLRELMIAKTFVPQL
jgi:hypothetical protein